MKRYYYLIIFVTLCGCATLEATKANTDHGEIIGKWVKVDTPLSAKTPYNNMQSKCTVSINIRADNTITAQSGKSISHSLYSVQSKGSGFLINLTNTKTNGKNNCQGLSDEYVKRHFVPYMYFERKGEYLRYYPRANYRNEYLQFKK